MSKLLSAALVMVTILHMFSSYMGYGTIEGLALAFFIAGLLIWNEMKEEDEKAAPGISGPRKPPTE